MDKLLVLGDIHGKWKKVGLIIEREVKTNGFALSTGDLCTYDFNAFKGRLLYFCQGNHENPEMIKKLQGQKCPFIAMLPGQVYSPKNSLRIVALPGVYSPHFFNKKGPLKYYSKNDLESLLQIKNPVDILITHEAPTGVGIVKNGSELGNPHINLLIDSLHPKIAIFGHHHHFFYGIYNGTHLVGTDMPHRSYILIDMSTLSIQRIEARLYDKQGYKYDWEDR